MKHLLIILIIIGSLYAIKSKNKDVVFDTNSTMPSKELAFQKYLNKREKENRQLENDGFCSCNNN